MMRQNMEGQVLSHKEKAEMSLFSAYFQHVALSAN